MIYLPYAFSLFTNATHHLILPPIDPKGTQVVTPQVNENEGICVIHLFSPHHYDLLRLSSEADKSHREWYVKGGEQAFCLLSAFVGMTGFEPATSRPPDAHSNRTELHPEALPSLFVWAKVLLFFDYTSTLLRDIFPLRFGAIVWNGEGR